MKRLYHTLTFMCPICKHIFSKSSNGVNIEKIKCENCKKYIEPIHIDDTLAPIIYLLNKKGYITCNGCCAGHVSHGYCTLYVSFEKNYFTKINPPPHFYFSEMFERTSLYINKDIYFKEDGKSDKSEFSIYEIWNELYNWVLKLPNRNIFRKC